jgi:hypothetical protein
MTVATVEEYYKATWVPTYSQKGPKIFETCARSFQGIGSMRRFVIYSPGMSIPCTEYIQLIEQKQN